MLVEAQFRGGDRFRWPTSLIHKITDDVRFAKAIDRPMYPTEWIITPHHLAGGGGGGGGVAVAAAAAVGGKAEGARLTKEAEKQAAVAEVATAGAAGENASPGSTSATRSSWL